MIQISNIVNKKDKHSKNNIRLGLILASICLIFFIMLFVQKLYFA